MNDEARLQALFRLFNEIGIIYQLATTLFNRRLPEGLHISHFSVIHHLCRLGDGCTPVQLASAFQVTRPTMTNTLTKLSARGFVSIKANPEDGRSKLVYLTESGRRFRDRAIAELYPVMEKMGNGMDIERLIGILPALEELRIYLDTNREVQD